MLFLKTRFMMFAICLKRMHFYLMKKEILLQIGKEKQLLKMIFNQDLID